MPQPDESTTRSVDDEAAFLRRVRFGALPPRVRPADYVEMTETDPPALDLLLSRFERDRWAALYSLG